MRNHRRAGWVTERQRDASCHEQRKAVRKRPGEGTAGPRRSLGKRQKTSRNGSLWWILGLSPRLFTEGLPQRNSLEREAVGVAEITSYSSGGLKYLLNKDSAQCQIPCVRNQPRVLSHFASSLHLFLSVTRKNQRKRFSFILNHWLVFLKLIPFVRTCYVVKLLPLTF